jgi:hypothetical protein
MLIKPSLIAGAEQRFKQANFSPAELNRKLGDGPLKMDPEKRRLRLHRRLTESFFVTAWRLVLSSPQQPSVFWPIAAIFTSQSLQFSFWPLP